MKESGEETHKEPNPLPKGEQYCDDVEALHKTDAINAADQFEDVIDFEHLYASMQKCRVGVLWKDSVASFYMHGIERIIRLERDLKDGTYKAKPPKSFMIYLPKKRNIVSICFRDRVYQRALNDYAIYPAMTKSFIYDNWACQKGKGTDAETAPKKKPMKCIRHGRHTPQKATRTRSCNAWKDITTIYGGDQYGNNSKSWQTQPQRAF